MSRKDMKPREVVAYYDYMRKLQKKYGLPSGPYIVISKDGVRRKNSKITRTKEGLYIHHIAEIAIPALSNELMSDRAPLVFQKPEQLVYCDILEHLLAHIMIVEASIADPYHDYVLSEGAGQGGINMMVGLLNDWYSGITPSETSWQYWSWLQAKDRKSEYKSLLKRAQRAMCTQGKKGSLKKLSNRKMFPR